MRAADRVERHALIPDRGRRGPDARRGEDPLEAYFDLGVVAAEEVVLRQPRRAHDVDVHAPGLEDRPLVRAAERQRRYCGGGGHW